MVEKGDRNSFLPQMKTTLKFVSGCKPILKTTLCFSITAEYLEQLTVAHSTHHRWGSADAHQLKAPADALGNAESSHRISQSHSWF